MLVDQCWAASPVVDYLNWEAVVVDSRLPHQLSWLELVMQMETAPTGRSPGGQLVMGALQVEMVDRAPAPHQVGKRRQMIAVVGEEIPGTGGEACRAPEPGEPPAGGRDA